MKGLFRILSVLLVTLAPACTKVVQEDASQTVTSGAVRMSLDVSVADYTGWEQAPVLTKADETYSDRMLGNLFYGYVEKTDLKHLPAGSVNTVIIPLVKNTNNIRVLLQSINSDINLTPEQFDFAIYDINAQLGWNDEIVNPAPLTYNPFNTKQGSVKLNDGTEVLTAAVAEFAVGRLFARTTDKTTLVITQKSTGKEVFNVPLVDYFLMVKGHYSRPMSDQEYLDRQDDYSVAVFLEHKEGPQGYYIAARIYINGWQIVLSNPDLS